MSLWSPALHLATAHGVASFVEIPDAPDPVPEEVLEQLPAAEGDLARSLGGFQQVQFVGGRLALRSACEQLSIRPPPLLRDERGAPIMPKGLVGSVSHKKTLAAAMVAHDGGWRLGVDLEDYTPQRLSIAPRILTERELAAVEPLSDDRRWMATLLRFSIKESIYKALDPYVQRYVGFHEAEIQLGLSGEAEVTLRLAHDEGPFEVQARFDWLQGRVLTSARIRPA